MGKSAHKRWYSAARGGGMSAANSALRDSACLDNICAGCAKSCVAPASASGGTQRAAGKPRNTTAATTTIAAAAKLRRAPVVMPVMRALPASRGGLLHMRVEPFEHLGQGVQHGFP